MRFLKQNKFMEIKIQLTREPIDRLTIKPLNDSTSVGALAEFSGIVRDTENGAEIAALEYEAYSPMADRIMREILDDLDRRHPCLSARVIHRIGIIPVGETAIHVVVTARHRAEAFAMLTEFMNRLKQDVPIWKSRALSGDELAASKKS